MSRFHNLVRLVRRGSPDPVETPDRRPPEHSATAAGPGDLRSGLVRGQETHAQLARRRAMTLVELLVAITIITMLMAISIPLVRYSLDGDKVREASRQLNMMLAGARTRAIERGRPVGVWLQRSDQNANAAVEVYLAESPPPYIGDVNGARVYIRDTNTMDTIPVDTICFDTMSTGFASYISIGDVVRFDRTGHYFQITSVDPTSTTITGFPPISGRAGFTRVFPESMLPPLSTSAAGGHLFEILRHPQRLNVSPLQLADGAVVDLRFSGVGAEGTQFAFSAGDANHVIVAFDATGALSYLFFDSSPQDIDGPVHLLVGKLDQLQDADSTPDSPNPVSLDSASPAVGVTYDKNVADQASIWVTVGSRNGTITTAENAWELRPQASWAGVPGPPFFVNSLRRAREFAQATDAMGGR